MRTPLVQQVLILPVEIILTEPTQQIEGLINLNMVLKEPTQIVLLQQENLQIPKVP